MGMGAGVASSVVPVVWVVSSGALPVSASSISSSSAEWPVSVSSAEGPFPVSSALTSSVPVSSAERPVSASSVSASPLESVVVTEGDAPSGLTDGSASAGGGVGALSEGLGRASREWLTAASLNP